MMLNCLAWVRATLSDFVKDFLKSLALAWLAWRAAVAATLLVLDAASCLLASSSKDCKRALSDRACLSSFCSWALVGLLDAALELTVLRIFWDSELSIAEEEDSRKADDDDFWLWALFFLLYMQGQGLFVVAFS